MTDQGTPMPIAYQNCIVSFIDILGFSQLVEALPPQKIHEAISRLQHATEPMQLEDEQHMQLAYDSGQVNPTFSQSLSDSVVRASILEPAAVSREGVFYPRDGLFFELHDLLIAQLALVDHGILVRGGITIGKLYVNSEANTPFFGPGMVRAYKIESVEAVFPRLVVDHCLLTEYLDGHPLLAQSEPGEDDVAELRSMLRTGEDGTVFLDYLSAAPSSWSTFAGYLNFLHRHRDLVQSRLDDDRLPGRVRRKFLWLANYHNDTVDGWLDEVANNPEFPTEYAAAGITDPISALCQLRVPVADPWRGRSR